MSVLTVSPLAASLLLLATEKSIFLRSIPRTRRPVNANFPRVGGSIRRRHGEAVAPTTPPKKMKQSSEKNAGDITLSSFHFVRRSAYIARCAHVRTYGSRTLSDPIWPTVARVFRGFPSGVHLAFAGSICRATPAAFLRSLSLPVARAPRLASRIDDGTHAAPRRRHPRQFTAPVSFIF